MKVYFHVRLKFVDAVFLKSIALLLPLLFLAYSSARVAAADDASCAHDATRRRRALLRWPVERSARTILLLYYLNSRLEGPLKVKAAAPFSRHFSPPPPDRSPLAWPMGGSLSPLSPPRSFPTNLIPRLDLTHSLGSSRANI